MKDEAKTPKVFLSLSRKVSELNLALSKSEATIRNQQIEIDRLNRQVAEARSQGLLNREPFPPETLARFSVIAHERGWKSS